MYAIYKPFVSCALYLSPLLSYPFCCNYILPPLIVSAFLFFSPFFILSFESPCLRFLLFLSFSKTISLSPSLSIRLSWDYYKIDKKALLAKYLANISIYICIYMYICIYCHGLSSSPFCFILVSFRSLPFSPVPNRSSLARIRSVSRRICPTWTDIISVRNRDLRVFVRTRSNKAERKRRPLPSSRAIDHRSQPSFPEVWPNTANTTTCTIFLSKFTSQLVLCSVSSDAFLTSRFLRRFLSFPERFCRLNLCGSFAEQLESFATTASLQR